MAKLERVYNIPLRKEFMKVPSHRKANKCIVAVKQFLAKHMHSEDVRLGTYLNDYIWSKGMKNPPHHVKVEAVREDDGRVFAELVGAPKAEAKAEAKEKKAEAKHEEHEGHKHEAEHKAEKKEAPKKEHKEEKKEHKAEKPKAEKKPAKKSEKKE